MLECFLYTDGMCLVLFAERCNAFWCWVLSDVPRPQLLRRDVLMHLLVLGASDMVAAGS